MENNSSSGKGGGISFCGLLTIVFIVLKLTGHIEWAWVWVLAPSWVPLAFTIVLIALGYSGVAVYDAMRSYLWDRKNRLYEELEVAIEQLKEENDPDKIRKLKIKHYNSLKRKNRKNKRAMALVEQWEKEQEEWANESD